ncbi:MAG TPA: ABC transporter permease [Limnochordia bacterium]|nr:ABC transporter permease [Limnochordia bacterium]
MSILEIWRMALRALGSNRLRTVLSVLGVVIGVASVVALVSIGHGSQKQITARISALGTNLITVRPGVSRGFGGRVSREAANVFTLDLAKEIQTRVPGVAKVAPTAQGSGLVSFGAANQRATFVGVTPEYTDVVDYHIGTGRFIHTQDLDADSPVIVLGSSVADTLFGGASPVGQRVGLVVNNRRLSFTVIGVMEAKGQVFFSNFDNQVYVPITTAMERLLGTHFVDGYSISAVSADASQETADALDYFLFRTLGSTDKYSVSSQDSLLDTLNQTTAIMTLFLAAIAGISLVVGGIGVMNIMLVSVTERTREIGLRKAIGGRRRHIVVQFLSEAALLGIAGGIIGVALGAAGSFAIAHAAKWPSEVSISAAITAFVFAALVGLVSGVYPAMRAAKLDPVVALRYD